MSSLATYDYAVIRVVPRVERGEFINAGVILSCAAAGLLRAAIELDETRLLALDPDADLASLRAGLEAIPRICAGGTPAGALGGLSVRERFHWLVAPRSSSIQTSPVHTGRCDMSERQPELQFERQLERLMARMVRPPSPRRAAPGARATTSG